jgi:hypothetical protein
VNRGHVEVVALIQCAAEVCLAALQESVGRKLLRAPVRPDVYYGCVMKAVGQIDLVLRVQWGAAGMRAGPIALAVQAVDLLRLGITIANANPADDWLPVLVRRAHQLTVLAGRGKMAIDGPTRPDRPADDEER